MPTPTPRPGQHWQHKESGVVIHICNVDKNGDFGVAYAGGTATVKREAVVANYRQMTTRESAAYELFGITDLGTVSDDEDEAIDQRLREDAQADAE